MSKNAGIQVVDTFAQRVVKRVADFKEEESPDHTFTSEDFARMFADAAAGQPPTSELSMQKEQPSGEDGRV